MGIVLFCLYVGAIAFKIIKMHKEIKQPASFFINNRSSSTFNVGFSIVVSCVGASATIGMVGMAFSVGTPAFWWLGMGAVGLFMLGAFLARKVRQSQAYTMPQLVEGYLGKPARPLVSIVIVVAWMAILAAQFSAMTEIIVSLTGLPSTICLILSFLLIVIHTIMGGQAAVMRIDGIQFLVILGGLFIGLIWLTSYNPSWGNSVTIEVINQDFPFSKLLYYFFIVGGSYLICPMLFGRLLSAQDEQTAQRGALFASAGLAISAVLIVSIGLACKGLIPAHIPPDKVLTTALITVLPNWLNLLILLALLSAIVSSADSCLITASTVLSHDLLHKKDVLSCQICIVALGCLGMATTFMNKSILGFLLMSYDVYVCGVVVPVLTGFLAHKFYRINPYYACIAIIVGGILGGISSVTESLFWSYLGLASAAGITMFGARKDHSFQILGGEHDNGNSEQL